MLALQIRKKYDSPQRIDKPRINWSIHRVYWQWQIKGQKGSHHRWRVGHPKCRQTFVDIWDELSCSPVAYTFYSSGIGRSVAILMAREGADITIIYLPEEQVDAEYTKKMVEAEKRECNLFSGNLMDSDTCRKAVESHIKR